MSILANLVENAIKYTEGETPINVAVRSSETGTVLTVKDQGQGIPNSEKKRCSIGFTGLVMKTHEGPKAQA